MHTEDVLTATGTGLWRWDSATGVITVDSVAARLLGLAADPEERGGARTGSGLRTLSEADLRARLHVVDYVDLQGIVTLAVTEDGSGTGTGTGARAVPGAASGTGHGGGDGNDGGDGVRASEALLRVVDEEARVLRTVRVRLRPRRDPPARDGSRQGPRGRLVLCGTVAEVPGPAYTQGSAAGDWRRNREAFLLDAGRALAEASSTGEVLRVASSLSMPGFTPNGLAVWGVDGEQLIVVGHHGYNVDPDKAEPFRNLTLDSPHPAAEVIRSGRAVYVPSPEEYQRRYPLYWPSVQLLGRQAWAFLPLIASDRTLGAWMAGFAHPVAFTPDERSVLTTVARMLAQALSRTSLHEAERELAATLQRTMGPLRKPDIKGMDVAARYVPTGSGLRVGGDWYDVIPLPSGRTALVIGDVQGHDVRAAAVMAQLRIALRAYAAEGHRPDAVLSRASRFLAGMRGGRPEAHGTGGDAPEGGGERRESDGGNGGDGGNEDGGADDGPGSVTARERNLGVGGFVDELAASQGGGGPLDGDDRFATCLYLEVDSATGTVDIARAGHPDPAIRLADGTVLIRPTAGGLPLGIEPDTDYPTTRLVLEPGETLLACTDGLIENGGHDMDSGWARVKRVFRRTAPRTRAEGARETTPTGRRALEEIADALVQAAHGPPAPDATGPLSGRREDDIALLLLTHTPPPENVPEAAVTRRTVLTIAQAEAERIGEARHQLQILLHDWTSEDQVDGAVLMLSEMLTNVLVHTDGDALMVAECSGERGSRLLRVEVADNSDEPPHRRQPGELASSGRGLVLLEMLAGAWGVDPRGEGKSIWFEIREDAAPPQWG